MKYGEILLVRTGSRELARPEVAKIIDAVLMERKFIKL
jgi:hypothetical protein